MDLTCLLSSLLFFVGDIIINVAFVTLQSQSIREPAPGVSVDQQNYLEFQLEQGLDGEFIRDLWKRRNELAPLMFSGEILTGLAWLFFTCPIIQLCYALSARGTRQLWLHVTMACLALTASCTEFFAALLHVGLFRSSNHLIYNFNLEQWQGTGNDYTGFKVLELTYFAFRGLRLWVDAFEYFALFFIFALYFQSIRTAEENLYQTLGIRLAGVGLFIGLLSFVDFGMLVLRLQDWRTFSPLAITLGNINRLILLPLWLIIMSCRLPKALGISNAKDQEFIATHAAELS